jgi:hypothetical protein
MEKHNLATEVKALKTEIKTLKTEYITKRNNFEGLYQLASSQNISLRAELAKFKSPIGQLSLHTTQLEAGKTLPNTQSLGSSAQEPTPKISPEKPKEKVNIERSQNLIDQMRRSAQQPVVPPTTPSSSPTATASTEQVFSAGEVQKLIETAREEALPSAKAELAIFIEQARAYVSPVNEV